MSVAAPAEIGAPYMSAEELAAFRAWLRAGAATYAEFGMGGSTLEAARCGFEHMVSVDSDRRWVDSVRAHPEIAPAIAQGRLAALHGDVGPTREWGNPLDDSQARRWPRYIQAQWSEWVRRGRQPDLILVDGRFRVACALSALLARDGDAAPLRVMVHDMQLRPDPGILRGRGPGRIAVAVAAEAHCRARRAAGRLSRPADRDPVSPGRSAA